MIIDCSANGLDVRPAAEAIVETTLQQIKDYPDHRIALVFGEDHAASTHLMLQISVMKMLQNQKISFSLAYEHDHDAFERILAEGQGQSQQALDFALSLNRVTPSLGMLFFMMRKIRLPYDAPLAHINLFNFLVRSSVPFAMADASLHPSSNTVAAYNAMAEKLALNSIKVEDPIYDRGDPYGLALRNITMVYHADKLAKKNDSQVVIQHCGTAHVVGSPDRKAQFNGSLTNVFGMAGYVPVPVYPLRDDYQRPDFDDGVYDFFDKFGVFIKSLDATHFSTLNSDELSFMDKISAASGGGLIYPGMRDIAEIDLGAVVKKGKDMRLATSATKRQRLVNEIKALVLTP